MPQGQTCQVIEFPEQAMAKVKRKSALEQDLLAILNTHYERYLNDRARTANGVQVTEKEKTLCVLHPPTS